MEDLLLLNKIFDELFEHKELITKTVLIKIRIIAKSIYQNYKACYDIDNGAYLEEMAKLENYIKIMDNDLDSLLEKEELASIQNGDGYCLPNGSRIYPQFMSMKEFEKELSTKTQYFYVPLANDDDIVIIYSPLLKIDINDINALASFAITLDMEQAVTEALGYTSALYTYYRQHNDANGALKSCFTKLTSSAEGAEFLTLTIQLQLLEKSFRENGISIEMMETYNRIASEYQRKLALNNKHHLRKKSEKEKINKF